MAICCRPSTLKGRGPEAAEGGAGAADQALQREGAAGELAGEEEEEEEEAERLRLCGSTVLRRDWRAAARRSSILESKVHNEGRLFRDSCSFACTVMRTPPWRLCEKNTATRPEPRLS
jgi:hypothetical protein